jgi:hypothetical protein
VYYSQAIVLSHFNYNVIFILGVYFMLSTLYKLFLSFFLLSSLAFAYDEHHESEWELGLAIGYAHLPTEGTKGSNLHIHVLKHLEGDDWRQYFSVGFGLEMIATDETHYATMLTLGIHPLEDFSLTLSSGLEFSKHDNEEWENLYSTHIEASYVFDVSEHFHLGPVIGYSRTKEAEHYTLGIHIGIPL